MMQGQTQTVATAQRPNRTVRGTSTKAATFLVLALALSLGACGGSGITQSFQRGYVLPEGALEQIPLGSSQEQVLIVLGTPSTVATISGEVFYYISQRTEQTSFLPQKEVNRRIIAIYFDKGRKVQRIADYGIRDGKIFDSVSRTTPSGGEELSYIRYMMRAVQLNP
jgi:outer membrane protein assembly factor BamE (lipoprotein component of BamABCDE complex)